MKRTPPLKTTRSLPAGLRALTVSALLSAGAVTPSLLTGCTGEVGRAAGIGIDPGTTGGQTGVGSSRGTGGRSS